MRLGSGILVRSASGPNLNPNPGEEMAQVIAQVLPRRVIVVSAFLLCAALLGVMLVAGVDAASAGQKFR